MAVLKHATLIHLFRAYETMRLVIEGCRKAYVADAHFISKGLGKGIFSAKNLKKGETIFITKGRLFRLEIKSANDSIKYRHSIGIGNDTWLDPFQTNPLRFVNHSCNPNVGIKGAVTFVALRDIRKDEHLTVDYSITECDKGWNFKIQTKSLCKCGEENCRKIIRSIQFLPDETYKKYLPFIPKLMQQARKK